MISDTHGLLRPEALAALKGCELLVHAGDVGSQEILNALGRIAPVVAIRGNIDTKPPTRLLPATADATVQGTRIFVLHDLKELDFDPAAEQYDLVVFGHSHKASRAVRSGVTYINPGSAGPRRFKLPVTVVRMTMTQPEWTFTLIDLESGGQSLL